MQSGGGSLTNDQLPRTKVLERRPRLAILLKYMFAIALSLINRRHREGSATMRFTFVGAWLEDGAGSCPRTAAHNIYSDPPSTITFQKVAR